MNRIFIAFLLIFFLCLPAPSGKVCAARPEELGEEMGVQDAADGLDENAAAFLEDNGIAPDSTDGVMELSPDTVLRYMWEELKSGAAAPLRLLGLIISVIILSAASAAAENTVHTDSGMKICRTVTVLTAVAVVVPYIEDCIDNVASTLKSGGEFMLCYVPVFAGVCAASGNISSSAAYSGVLLFAAQAAASAVSRIIMPAVSMCMAMNIIDAVNPGFSLSAVTEVVKKWSCLFMGFIMTVFTGLLSVQSIVGAAADTVGIKAAKFMVSNLVPVVGNAVADAYNTMRSGLGLLKGAAGAFGIIALAAVLLPPVIETACMYLAMTAGEAAASLFGLKDMARFFRGTSELLSLLTALLACFGVMFIISTIILMAAGTGV